MTISLLFLVGRFLLAVPVVLLGVDRLRTGSAGERLVALVGVAAAAAMVLGAWGDLAAAVLALQIVVAEAATRPRPRPEDVVTAVGLVGGAVVVASTYVAVGAALDWTLTAPVWDLDLR